MTGDVCAQRGIGEDGGIEANEALGDVGHAVTLASAGRVRAADHVTLVSEQIFGDVPALAGHAHQVFLGHLHIVKKRLAEGRGAGDQLDRAGRHAFGGHVEQQEADAQMLGCSRIGADKAEDPVGLVGIAGPHL